MRRLVSVGICVFLTLTLAACTEEVTGSSGAAQQHGRTSDVAESGSELPRNPTASRTGPLPGGAASCVESYSPDALSHRAFAFDGVVMKLGP